MRRPRALSNPPWRGLSLRARLGIGMGTLVGLVVALSLISLSFVGSLRSSASDIARNSEYLDSVLQAAGEAKGAANDERGFLLAGDQEFADGFADQLADVRKELTRAAAVFGPGTKQAAAADAVRADVDAWGRAVTAEFAQFRRDPQGARALALGKNRDLRVDFEERMEAADDDLAEAGVAAAEASAENRATTARTVLIAGMLLAVLLGAAVTFVVVRSIERPIRRVAAAARAIAGGDVQQRVEATTRDDIGQMTASFSEMVAYLERMASAAERLAGGDLTVDVTPASERDALGTAIAAMIASFRGLVGNVAGAASSLTSESKHMAATSDETGRAVDEIAAAVSEVAHGAERQVRTLEGARSATEEVVRLTDSSTREAQETAANAKEARELATQGARVIAEATDAMQSVRESSVQITAAIRELGMKSDEIGGIVGTITGIAEQTNLLALNAAIEAARAGEQGRGFAVVADEVRKLAEGSRGATASIAALVREIQAETSRVVDVVEDGARRTERGADTVQQARASFEQIGASVQEMTDRVEHITVAIEQIAAGSRRVQHDISEIAAVAEQSSTSAEEVSASTEETSASTQEVASSAQQLATTAAELDGLVGRFSIG